MKPIVKYAEIRMGDISVSVKGEFYGEDYELFFQHPMTGSWNTHLDSIMVGWSEMDPKDNKEWEKLLEKSKKTTCSPKDLDEWASYIMTKSLTGSFLCSLY